MVFLLVLISFLAFLPRVVSVQGADTVKVSEGTTLNTQNSDFYAPPRDFLVENDKVAVYEVGGPTEQSVIELIHKYFDAEDITQAIETARCESGMIPQQSKVIRNGIRENSWGVWQIHLSAHLDISKAQAMDIEWSTKWASEQFRSGHQSMWTCWRQIYGI